MSWVGIEGRAALVVDDYESRTIDSTSAAAIPLRPWRTA